MSPGTIAMNATGSQQLRHLGDGLVLRRASAADADALCAFQGDVQRYPDAAEPHEGNAAWTRDLMSGRHPTFRPEDALIVEERATGRIVSSAMLVSQVLSFGGVPVPVGQPELIATRPEYRGRGLVRGLLATLHAWSAERGHAMQLIAGIPWFYRQFGYEMAIERGGGPVVPLDQLPVAANDTLHVRPVRAVDIPFVAALMAEADRRYLLTVPRDERTWRYELEGHERACSMRVEWRLIERARQPIGVCSYFPSLWDGALAIMAFEVIAGAPWRGVLASTVPALADLGETLASQTGTKRVTSLSLWWPGREHPLCRIVERGETRRPMALYVRVPDVPRLVRLIAPVLERRLATSPLAGYTGQLRIGFYRHGVAVDFRDGVIEGVGPWRPTLELPGQDFGWPSDDRRRADALFPGLTFLQALCGFRSLDELEAAFPDCIMRTGQTRDLVKALFPRHASRVWPVL